MALPPLLAGAVKAIEAWPLPGMAVPMVGAPGAVELSTTDWVTCAAARKFALPDWLAAMVQVPGATIVTVVPAMVQTDAVVELYSTVRPELADAVGETRNVLPATKLRLVTDWVAKVMVCAACETLNPCVTEVAAL